MTAHYYPWETRPDSPRVRAAMKEWEEPDVIETAQGFAPNYDKLAKYGLTPEEALIWCNMD